MKIRALYPQEAVLIKKVKAGKKFLTNNGLNVPLRVVKLFKKSTLTISTMESVATFPFLT